MATSQGTVIWFEIWVQDLDRAKEFYSTVFNWSFKPYDDYDAENYWLIDAGQDAGVNGALVRSPDGGRATGRQTVVYVHVPDLDQAVKAVEGLGGSVRVPAKKIGQSGGSFAIVVDGEGNEIGLWIP